MKTAHNVFILTGEDWMVQCLDRWSEQLIGAIQGELIQADSFRLRILLPMGARPTTNAGTLALTVSPKSILRPTGADRVSPPRSRFAWPEVNPSYSADAPTNATDYADAEIAGLYTRFYKHRSIHPSELQFVLAFRSDSGRFYHSLQRNLRQSRTTRDKRDRNLTLA